MSDLPIGLVGGESGHVAWHNSLHLRAKQAEQGRIYNVLHYGALGNGVADDTTAIAAAVAAAPAGGVVYFPAGVYRTAALVLTKALHLRGDGPYSSWLVPTGAATAGLVQYNVPAPVGTVRAVYGPSFRGLGIDLTSFGTTVGLAVSSTTGWFQGSDFYMQGGAVHVRNAGTNNRFERFRLVDAGKFFEIDGDTGLELRIRDGDCLRFSAGTTSWGIEIIGTLSGGNGGALYLDRVVVNCGLGGAVLNGGILMQMAGNVSVPIFAHQFIYDNGSGPGVKLVNALDAYFNLCWINAAAGTGVAVQITAGGNVRFTDSHMLGGVPATGGTFEFLGSVATAGFHARGNYCPSGPVYRFTGSGGVTDLFTDDHVPGATVTSQVTNDEAKFLAGAARRWGRLRLQQVPEAPAETVHFVGAGGEPAWQNGWGNVLGEATFFWKDPGGTVHLSGQLTGGGDVTVAFTLPAGYRPFGAETFSVPNGFVVVNNAGSVTLATGGLQSSVSGITFRALN